MCVFNGLSDEYWSSIFNAEQLHLGTWACQAVRAAQGVVALLCAEQFHDLIQRKPTGCCVSQSFVTGVYLTASLYVYSIGLCF